MDQDENGQLQEFNPRVAGGERGPTNLRNIEELENVRGEDLHQVLPECFDILYLEGNADSSFLDYQRVLQLLQSNRSWEFIKISDVERERSSPDLLRLVVLAPTKTSEIYLMDCPLDSNFFACFNLGIQTLRTLNIVSSSISISSEATTILADSLASTISLERLSIGAGARFEDDAARIKLVEGIQRNNSLTDLIMDESSVGAATVQSILTALSEGALPKLSFLSIKFQAQNEVAARLVTKLMSSDKSNLETLMFSGQTPTLRTENGASRGGASVNRRLKTLLMSGCSLDASNLKPMLSMMPMLERIALDDCGISDLAPIIDFLRNPSCSVKKISLRDNNIGVPEVEKFISFIAEMPSLTYLIIRSNPWCDEEDDEDDEERIGN